MLLKVNMGIAHRYLREKGEAGEPGEQLTPLLIENLFELWLFSGVQKQQLFDSFATLASEWTFREPFLAHWFSVCDGLNKRMLHLLYNVPYPYIPTLIPQIQGESNSIQDAALAGSLHSYVVVLEGEYKGITRAKLYNLPVNQVLYLWYRMLFLFEKRELGSAAPETSKATFTVGKCYAQYIEYIARLLKQFAGVARLTPRRTKAIHVTTSEAEKAARAEIVPRFVQSPSFRADLVQLYAWDLISGRLDSIRRESVERGSSLQKLPNGNVILALFGLNIFAQHRPLVIAFPVDGS